MAIEQISGKAPIKLRNRLNILSPLFILVLFAVFFSCRSPKDVTSTSSKKYYLIFDGNTLDGWEYDPEYWRVEDGNLVGEVTAANLLKRNSFIIKKDLITKDFDLKVEYRVSAKGNSGINYRSETIDSLPYAMRGYQSDIDGENLYTGQNYEERGRTTLAYYGEKVIIHTTEDSSSLIQNTKDNVWTKRIVLSSATPGSIKKFINNNDWNECRLIVKGNRMLHYVNGVLMSDVTDNDAKNSKFSGRLGVQVHVGPPMKIEYKNFRIKVL